MKKTAAVSFVLILLAAAPLRANLRAPKRVDGFLSGQVRNIPLAWAVVLARESMAVVFPEFKKGLSEYEASIRVSVRYEIESKGTMDLSVPVRFVAVDIRNLEARLNGALLAVEGAPDPGERKECLIRLARHRSAFLPPLYAEFLDRLMRGAGLAGDSGPAGLAALESRDLGQIPFNSVFSRSFSSGQGDTDFKTAAMTLVLRPGRNELNIVYRQKPFVEERGYGYTAAWPEKGFTGFDYCLYPASSWPPAPDFTLSLRIEVPEYPKGRLFGTSWKKPFLRSNLELAEEKTATPRTRVWRGEFRGLPADILTVLVWFDEKAKAYLER